jgi:hypothetical protein
VLVWYVIAVVKLVLVLANLNVCLAQIIYSLTVSLVKVLVQMVSLKILNQGNVLNVKVL